MIGTIVNAAAIIAGGLIGVFLGKRVEQRFHSIALQAMGLMVTLIGLQMALTPANTLIIIGSIVVGSLLGEWIGIEKRLESVGEFLQKKFGSTNGTFVRGFVTASLLYCVGSMAILGAIQDGLGSEPSILYAKSILDGVTAIAFASTLGVGVMVSAVPVVIYQGAITLVAVYFGDFASEVAIQHITAIGGLMIVGLGLNMLEVAKIRVGNMLPSVFLAFFLALFFA